MVTIVDLHKVWAGIAIDRHHLHDPFIICGAIQRADGKGIMETIRVGIPHTSHDFISTKSEPIDILIAITVEVSKTRLFIDGIFFSGRAH